MSMTDTLTSLKDANEAEQTALTDTLTKAQALDAANVEVAEANAKQSQASADLQTSLASLRTADAAKHSLLFELGAESPAQDSDTQTETVSLPVVENQ